MADRWPAVRVERLSLWLSLDHPAVWTGLALVATAWLARRNGLDPPAAQVIGLIGALVVALVGGLEGFPSGSLWRAWPIGLIVAVPRSDSLGPRGLWTLLFGSSLGVWLTSTHDGGAQWGPRFLLIAAPCLGVLSGLAVSAVSSPGRFAALRRAIVAAIVVAGMWTSRTAYLELRSAKRHSAELVNAIESAAPVGTFVLTDIWWLGQLAAPLHATRGFLFVGSVESATEALATLRQAGVHRVVLAGSDEATAVRVLDTAVSGTCFTPGASTRAVARRVVLRNATCTE